MFELLVRVLKIIFFAEREDALKQKNAQTNKALGKK